MNNNEWLSIRYPEYMDKADLAEAYAADVAELKIEMPVKPGKMYFVSYEQSRYYTKRQLREEGVYLGPRKLMRRKSQKASKYWRKPGLAAKRNATLVDLPQLR